MDTERVLTLHSTCSSHTVCGGVRRTGPAGGLPPLGLEEPHAAGQTHPLRAGVVGPSIARVWKKRDMRERERERERQKKEVIFTFYKACC